MLGQRVMMVRVRHYAYECPHKGQPCVCRVCVRRDRVQQLV